jgi:mono/diheme cytochrome c family protein
MTGRQRATARLWPSLVLLLAAAAPAVHAQDAPAGAAASAAEAGRKIYVTSCQRCHGINLVTSGIGFDLRSFPQHEKERFVRSVNQGVRAMPAWGGTLKPDQLELIWAYIGTVNGWKSPP